MKPIWHTGPWSEEQTQDLLEELRLAEQTRSLTNEEQSWLEQRMNYEQFKKLVTNRQGCRFLRSMAVQTCPEEYCIRLLKEYGKL